MDIPPTVAGLTPASGQRLPARTGAVPALANGFITRPETAPDLPAALVPGAVVALVNAGPPQRAGSCGKTQLAAFCAEAFWRSGRVGLLAWVQASNRASLLAGYAQTATAVGIDPTGPAEHVAARFTGWLAETAQPWLLVVDDLRDQADLDGLRPAGPAGTVIITAREEGTVAGAPRVRVVPVGAFSPREAMKYLMGRLSDDTDQRHGAIGLAGELHYDPCALTQASSVIASTMLTCRTTSSTSPSGGNNSPNQVVTSRNRPRSPGPSPPTMPGGSHRAGPLSSCSHLPHCWTATQSPP